MMLAIRLYVCVLTITFLVLLTMNRGVGILEGIVITSAFVYLILDTRDDLKLVKTELRQLQDLEKQLAVLLGD
jgi:type VI protein secretion system component VasK